ncbi:MAG: DNA repair and recombination protein RadB [Candidatus Nanoarchaeia archaeon]
MKLSTGTSVLDRFLNGGFDRDCITTVYGAAGVGKTTLTLLATISAVQEGKRVIYMDTEGGFSIERLKQLTHDYENILKNIIFLNPTTFQKQKEAFDKLRGLATDDIGLIVVDSIAMLYRMELGKADDIYGINRDLGRQIGYLTDIARTKTIPILVTNQVYSQFDSREKVNMVGGDVLKYGSKCLLELKKTNSRIRRAMLAKHRSIPEHKETYFHIEEDGLAPAEAPTGFRKI